MFRKNELVEIKHYKDSLYWFKAIFIAYDEDSKEFPYIARELNKKRVSSYPECRMNSTNNLPELEIDTPVWVREHNNTIWYPHHFHSWDIQDNKNAIRVWAYGKTSHTIENKKYGFYSWPIWSLEDPQDKTRKV